MWRSVIQLNLIRSIRIIMDAVVSALHERAVRIDSGDESDSDMENSLGPLDDVRSVAARLAPIRTMEATLISKLVPRGEEEPTRLTAEEVFVRPDASWKGRIHACRLDMIAIWNHSSTREILRRRGLRLEDSPGLYV
jgi:guanine nucleotide-binding protein alpha-1 subunit